MVTEVVISLVGLLISTLILARQTPPRLIFAPPAPSASRSRGRHHHPRSKRVLLALPAILVTTSSTRCEAEAYPAAKNQYIVEFSPFALQSSSTLRARGLATGETQPISPFSSVSLIEVRDDGSIGTPSQTPPIVQVHEVVNACQHLIRDGLVTSCSPNYRVQASRLPNETGISTQYWHSVIDSPRAWDVTVGGESAVVAVLDSGVDYTHPDLVDNMWRNPGEVVGDGIDNDGNGVIDDIFGYNGINNSGNPYDDHSHGTHVAGIIGARGNNSVGVAGVNWNTRIMALKFLSAGGWGYTSDAIKALDYMVAMKQRGVNVRVVNNSWGGGGSSKPLEDAIRRVQSAGIVFTAAAGNSASDNDVLPQYPASYPVANVVAVASSDELNELSSFSCFGAQSVHIAAPGSSILSTVPGNQYQPMSGTSMATPFVSGALGLLFSREPSLSVAEAIDRLYRSGTSLPTLEGAIATGRLLNVGNLMTATYPPAPVVSEVCDYTTQQIPFNPPPAVASAPIQSPRAGATYLDNYTLNLPFDFPFYQRVLRTLVVSPNGVVFTEGAQFPWSYRDSLAAPLNSIAPLYTYLYDFPITRDPRGVRVLTSADRVDIQWQFAHPWNPSVGDLRFSLSLFSNGTIESHITVPDDRLARTLQYGSVVGIRGANLANSKTITHNNFPIVLRGNLGFRFTRPGSCVTTSVQPTPAPTATATPIPTNPSGPGATPTPTPVSTPSTRPSLTSLAVIGPKGKRNVVESGKAYRVTFESDSHGSVPLQVSLNGAACVSDLVLATVGQSQGLRVKMPRVGRRFQVLTLRAGGLTTNAQIRGKKRPGAVHSRHNRGCALVVQSFKRAVHVR